MPEKSLKQSTKANKTGAHLTAGGPQTNLAPHGATGKVPELLHWVLYIFLRYL